MTESLVPFSLRLDETKIESLKQKARVISAEMQADISYTDLIRNAIDDISIPFNVISIQKRPDFARFMEKESECWTETEKKEFLRTPTGLRIKESLNNTDDWKDILQIGQDMYKYWMDNYCIARKILAIDSDADDRPCYERPLSSIGAVVSMRGAVADIINEGREVPVPIFEIASNPTIEYKKVSPSSVFQALSMGIKCIQKELDINIVNALEGLLTFDKENIIDRNDENSPYVGDFKSAIKKLMSNGISPKYILMNPSIYVECQTFGKEFLGINDMSKAIETREYGSIHDARILLSSSCPASQIFVLAKPETVGILVDKSGLKIEKEISRKKLREEFVLYVSTGIYISNNWAISMIQLKGENGPMIVMGRKAMQSKL